jgi:pectate lyase
LKVTFHHNWWAENVVQRMPRVRFGQVHLFNNLYTSTGNNYCVGVGVGANILAENNVFIGVNDPIETAVRSNANSVVVSRGNGYEGTSGSIDDLGDNVFQPPYPYLFSATGNVEEEVRAGAGVH